MLKKVTIIVAMCLGTFMCLLDETIMNIVLPEIQNSLHTNLAGMTWAINSYTILFAALTIPFGRLAERIGVHKTFIGGLLVFMIGSIVSAEAHTINILIVGRIVQAIGVSAVFPLSMVIGISTLSVARRMIVIAALGMTQGLAGALGPSIGGILSQYLSWRWVFLINIPMVILAVILCLLSLNLKENVSVARVDFVGSLLSIIVLFSLTLALVQGNDWKWNSPLIIGLFVLSIVGLVIFIWYERRIEAPMIPMRLFSHRQYDGAALTILLSTIFFVGVLVVLPTYFVRIQNHTDLAAALLITPASAMIFLFSPVAAVTVEKLGARLTVFIGILSMGIAYILFWNINMGSQWQVSVACAALGFGYGILVGSMQTLAAADFTGDLLAASQPVALVMRLVGFALAAAIFISALNTNASTAKNQSITYAKSEIAALNLSSSQTKTMENKVIDQISQEKASTPEKYKTSTSEINALIDENLKKLPVAIREQARGTVSQQVLTAVKNTDYKINTAITRIGNHTKKNFSDAFIIIYKIATPFIFALLLLVFVFYRKSKTLSDMKG
ncbi:MAG: MFS transporter [Streptococcaceae bacterium]|jgi:EmrB/QacA subfamily drug resistance transporter|nr:MFS transporter [Streptococcaceae bacterium]